jgi:hypothetical protein
MVLVAQVLCLFSCQLNAEPKKFKTTYKRHKNSAKKKPVPFGYLNSTVLDDRCYICFEYIEHINKRPRSMPSQRGNKCAHKLCLKTLLEELSDAE